MSKSPNSSDYDVIVLGGGAPGEHCAGALAEGGLRVAVVERDLVGGECSYWACIPSKTLLRPGEAVARRAEGRRIRRGGRCGGARLAGLHGLRLLRRRAGSSGWPIAESSSCAVAAGWPASGPSRWTARATPPTTWCWPTAPTRSSRRLTGLRELDGVWGTREATGMKAVPERLIVLGGGPAGVELAQVVHRLGGEVALVEAPSGCWRANPLRSATRW